MVLLFWQASLQWEKQQNWFLPYGAWEILPFLRALDPGSPVLSVFFISSSHALKGAVLGSSTLDWNASTSLPSQLCPSLNREHFRLPSRNGNHQTKVSAPLTCHWSKLTVGDQKHPSGISQQVSHPCTQTCPAFQARQPPTGLCIPWLEPELQFPCLP